MGDETNKLKTYKLYLSQGDYITSIYGTKGAVINSLTIECKSSKSITAGEDDGESFNLAV